MGIGRRAFLKFSSMALAGAIVNPFQSIITHKDAYVNRKLGILFYKPADWGFVHVRDFGKLKNSQVLNDEWVDDSEEVWKELGDPVCIATKYFIDTPENYGVFSPTITLNIMHKSELGEEYDDYEELMKASELGTSLLLKDFKVVKRYDPYKISGCRFFESDAEYMFEHAQLNGLLKVELKTIKAEHNDYYYDFNCHQSVAQNQTAVAEFEAFKKSIKLI